MAGKVLFSVTMSLDGLIAPAPRTDDPDAQRWTAQWMELQRGSSRSGSSGRT